MGTLTVSYAGSPSGSPVTYSASATLSDADAATIIAWALTQRTFGSPPPKTPQDAFNALAKGFADDLQRRVVSWQKAQAAAAATATVKPVTLTPSA